ncbi:MAG: radical SAM protein [Spirochaetaceae bacterium]|nr:MAG: radical SAM protein [Spirochaetaceae bacterium]
MRILLVSPAGDFLGRSRAFADFVKNSREMRTILHYWNGLGAALPTVAALTAPEHSVLIVDENYQKLDLAQDVDLVGISAMTQQAVRAYEIAAAFRQRGIHVALGGIHATVLPDEAAQHVDTVFVGEAEHTWPLFLQDFVQGTPRKVYRASDHKSVDMAAIPLPRYDLLAETKYPVVWVQATRGCPHDCEFCTAPEVYGTSYRHKSAAQVAAEIREVKRYWKNAQVGFADDNMFVNRKFVRELMTEFESIPFTWYAQSDIAIATDSELLRRLHETGCRIVFIGLESVVEGNLVNLNGNKWKARRFARYGEHIRAIQENGIGVYASFIVGMEEDDHSVFNRTIDFVNEHHIMGAQVTILTPFPGSRLRQRLLDSGRITSSDWSLYTAWNPVIRHPLLSAAELEEGLLRIYRSIYSEESYRDRAKYFRQVFHKLVPSN